MKIRDLGVWVIQGVIAGYLVGLVVFSSETSVITGGTKGCAVGGAVLGALAGILAAKRTAGRPEAASRWRWSLWGTVPGVEAGMMGGWILENILEICGVDVAWLSVLGLWRWGRIAGAVAGGYAGFWVRKAVCRVSEKLAQKIPQSVQEVWKTVKTEEPIHIKDKGRQLRIITLIQFLVLTITFSLICLRDRDIHGFSEAFLSAVFGAVVFLIPFVLATFHGLKILESKEPKRIYRVWPEIFGVPMLFVMLFVLSGVLRTWVPWIILAAALLIFLFRSKWRRC